MLLYLSIDDVKPRRSSGAYYNCGGGGVGSSKRSGEFTACDPLTVRGAVSHRVHSVACAIEVSSAASALVCYT